VWNPCGGEKVLILHALLPASLDIQASIRTITVKLYRLQHKNKTPGEGGMVEQVSPSIQTLPGVWYESYFSKVPFTLECLNLSFKGSTFSFIDPPFNTKAGA